jgi:hypothetical protein
MGYGSGRGEIPSGAGVRMGSNISLKEDKPATQERRLEIYAAILLSIAALGSSWSGYQSARWSGVQSTKYSQANATRVESTRASTAAGQLQGIDVQLFTHWLNAYAVGNQKLEQFYSKRFRAEFLPAFETWLNSNPMDNPKAAPSPFGLPEYKLALNEQATQAETEAARIFKEGQAANQQSDDYVLNTVALSMVMFLVSIAGASHSIPARTGLLVVAALICVVGVYHLAVFPII